MRIVASKYFIGTVYSFDAPTQSPLWHAVTAFGTLRCIPRLHAVKRLLVEFKWHCKKPLGTGNDEFPACSLCQL